MLLQGAQGAAPIVPGDEKIGAQRHYPLIIFQRVFRPFQLQQQAGAVSTENLFYDLSRELIAWSVLGGGGGGGGALSLPPPAPRESAAMRQRLQLLLGGRWNRRWLKKADKRPRKAKEKRPLPGGHASVWKLMQAAKHQRAEKS